MLMDSVRGSEYDRQRHHTCIEQLGNTDIDKVIIPVLNNTVPVRSIHQWIVIMSRIDTNFPLNQTYQVYQDGFGNLTSNFWLGLTRIYYITNSAVNGGRTYRLRFELLADANSK
jgi:Fibrinogen beta and gamma chains, C-terminal globular domain